MELKGSKTEKNLMEAFAGESQARNKYTYFASNPTYNAGLYHEMEVLLSELANKDVKNHLLGWYGSHCWASKAVAKIQEWNETKLHYEPVGEPVDMKQAITPEVKAQCEALGKAMAEKLLAE